MRAYNFSAGPAMLPDEVMLIAQQEMLDWHGTGMVKAMQIILIPGHGQKKPLLKQAAILK